METKFYQYKYNQNETQYKVTFLKIIPNSYNL